MRPVTPRKSTITLLAIPLAAWLGASTSFATEMDAKPDSSSSKTAQAAKNKKGSKKKDASLVPACGEGATPIGESVTLDGRWQSVKSTGSPSCQPPAGQAQEQTQAQAGPVNTLEDIYVATSAEEVLEPQKTAASESPSDSPR